MSVKEDTRYKSRKQMVKYQYCLKWRGTAFKEIVREVELEKELKEVGR